MPNIVIFDVVSENIDGNTRQLLFEDITKTISETRKFSIINRKNLDAILKEQQLSLEDFTEQTNIFRLGQLLNADYILFPSVYVKENTAYVYLKLTDVTTGETLYPQSVTSLPDYKSLLRNTRTAVYQLSSNFDIKGTVVRDKSPEFIVNLGMKHGIMNNDILYVYRKGEKVYDPQTLRIIGYDSKKIGELIVIEAISENLARTRLIQGDFVSEGDEVILLDRSKVKIASESDKKKFSEAIDYAELLLNTIPHNARVYVNNRFSGRTKYAEPLIVELTENRYLVRIEKEGFNTIRRVVDLKKGQQSTANINLTPVCSELFITSEPSGAMVYVDGQYEGKTPARIRRFSNGKASIVLSKSGFNQIVEKAKFELGKNNDIHFKMKKDKQGQENDFDGMVYITGGQYKMGTNDSQFGRDARPEHLVELNSFYIDKYEVLVKEYRQFCEVTGNTMPELPGWIRENHPMINVSWQEAKSYAKWAGKRLPTEAEWEYAYSELGMSSLEYSVDRDTVTARRYCNIKGQYSSDEWRYTAPAGSFQPNELGIHDMGGNVFEWCEDWYDDIYYTYSVKNSPVGPTMGKRKVIRGGCWAFGVYDVSIYTRSFSSPDTRSSIVGFRCVKDIDHVKEQN